MHCMKDLAPHSLGACKEQHPQRAGDIVVEPLWMGMIHDSPDR